MKFNLSFLISAGILSAVAAEKHLRVAGGWQDQVEELVERQLRELATSGSTSQSISFGFAHQSSLADCFDCEHYCAEIAETAALTYTTGNDAYADAAVYLYAESCCYSISRAYAAACAFTKASGKINVNTTSQVAGTSSQKTAALSVTLDTSVCTLAFAASEAEASAYASVDTFAYTTVDAYCAALSAKNLPSPYCSGFAASGLVTIGTAAAGAKGQALSIAGAGASTNLKAAVSATGTGLAAVSGLIDVYSGSWAFASASSTAEAFAAAFNAAITGSYAETCAGVYEKTCGMPDSKAFAVCSQSPEVACADALAIGGGIAGALAAGCAEACAGAVAQSELHVAVSANVDCSGAKPKLLYSCAKAGAWAQCG